MLVGMTVGMLMHLNHPKDEDYFFKFLGWPFRMLTKEMLTEEIGK